VAGEGKGKRKEGKREPIRKNPLHLNRERWNYLWIMIANMGRDQFNQDNILIKNFIREI
jgi:hypothetical protein